MVDQTEIHDIVFRVFFGLFFYLDPSYLNSVFKNSNTNTQCPVVVCSSSLLTVLRVRDTYQVAISNPSSTTRSDSTRSPLVFFSDVYLTGNPSISFFKSLYKRYTSFAIESIETTFSGSVGFGKRVTVTIPRNGDLLHHLFLEVTMTKHASNASFHPAEQFVKEVELEIGGQRVDKLYSDWFRIFSELYHSADEKSAYKKMTDFDDNAAGGDAGVSKRFYLPICFFFTRSPALALPLVALQCTYRADIPIVQLVHA